MLQRISIISHKICRTPRTIGKDECPLQRGLLRVALASAAVGCRVGHLARISAGYIEYSEYQIGQYPMPMAIRQAARASPSRDSRPRGRFSSGAVLVVAPNRARQLPPQVRRARDSWHRARDSCHGWTAVGEGQGLRAAAMVFKPFGNVLSVEEISKLVPRRLASPLCEIVLPSACQCTRAPRRRANLKARVGEGAKCAFCVHACRRSRPFARPSSSSSSAQRSVSSSPAGCHRTRRRQQ